MGYKDKEEIQVINMKVFKLNQLLDKIQSNKRSSAEHEEIKNVCRVNKVKSPTYTKLKNILKNSLFLPIILTIIAILVITFSYTV